MVQNVLARIGASKFMKKKTKQPVNMLEGPYAGKVLSYTIPIILTGLLQLAFNAADLIVVGQFCGSTAVGAVGATGSLTNLFVNLFMGLSVGAGVAVAQSLGSGNRQATERIVHTSLPLSLLCGIVLTLLGVFLSEPMLKIMDTPAEELPLATVYMEIYFCGSTASLVYNFGASILRAAGDTKSPLIFLTASGILNVGLNVVFVTVFEMNVAGVALATVLSQALSALLVVLVLMRRTDACRFSLRKMRFHTGPLKKILRIGIPSGIQSSLFSIANVQIQSAVNSFGSVVLAGNSAASNIGNFAMIPTNAFHQTAVNFVGQNVGARRPDNVRKIFHTCILGAIIVGTVTGGLVTIFAEPLLKIYITDSPKAVFYGIERIACVYLPCLLAGIMEVATGSLRGMGSSVSPMLTSVLGVCGLRIVWLHTVFRWIHTPACLYLSFPVSWLVTFLVLFVIYRITLRKKEKAMTNNP